MKTHRLLIAVSLLLIALFILSNCSSPTPVPPTPVPQPERIQFAPGQERAVRSGRIAPVERQNVLELFSASLRGYTYFED